MPARIVDGDALWRSRKLKKVPARFRSEYANLLPLAQANGVFECDAESVWADVYSFNRPEISVEIVEEILEELERADLLRRWQPNGKIYGYWVGIEKPGRLPSEGHVKRYKNLPPNPPKDIFRSDNLSRIIPDNPGTCPEGLVLDWIGMDREGTPSQDESLETGQENEPMKATKQIPILCQTILGVKTKLYPEQVVQIQALEAEHKGSAVINAFGQWSREHRHDEIRKPIDAFLLEAEDLLGGEISAKPEKDPEITNLARELTYISGGTVQFTDKHKSRLATQVDDGFTPDEIITAFRGVFDAADKDNVRFIAKNFVETVDQIVYASRKRKSEEIKNSDFMARESARLEREAAEERDRRRNLPENQIEETLGM